MSEQDPPRPKSEQRQRTGQVNVRFTPDELARLDALAAKARLRRGTFLRQQALGDAGPRAQRQPSANQQLLGQVLAQAGKIGSNVNQLAHRANMDGFGAIRKAEMDQVISEISDLRAALMEALGRKGF